MKSIYKRYFSIAAATVLGTTMLYGATNALAQENDHLSKFMTTLNLKSTTDSKYATNPNGFGQYKTINDFSDWSEDMIIAQGVANDDARIFRGSHEGPVYDTYALYGAWDDDNLYLTTYVFLLPE